MNDALPYLGMTAGATTCFALAWVISRTPPLSPPVTGQRGVKRREAMAGQSGFALLEPWIRRVGGWYGSVSLGNRQRLDEHLLQGGSWQGLSADEFLGYSTICALLACAVSIPLVKLTGLPDLVVAFCVLIGAFYPWVRLSSRTVERHRKIDRNLPAAIDLTTLCMNAGKDFPGALRQLVNKTEGEDECVEEFNLVLQDLELGHTRRQALEAFARRAPTEPVKDFVSAVVQAEERGNPLVETLAVQATNQRLRRSLSAEQNAARAAVMLFGPLMLIFIAIIILLMGPFVIQGMNSGL
jgi:tight adherence protein C